MAIVFWVVVALIVLAVYAIRYIIKKAIYTGVDEVSNAYKRKKNSETSDTSENLSDRYKQ